MNRFFAAHCEPELWQPPNYRSSRERHHSARKHEKYYFHCNCGVVFTGKVDCDLCGIVYAQAAAYWTSPDLHHSNGEFLVPSNSKTAVALVSASQGREGLHPWKIHGCFTWPIWKGKSVSKPPIFLVKLPHMTPQKVDKKGTSPDFRETLVGEAK